MVIGEQQKDKMKPAKELLNEVGETVMLAFFADYLPPGVEVEKLIERIQADARKDGLMTALNIASETIRAESPKYATGKPEEGVNGQNTLSGLGYVVTSAILKEADALEYLQASNESSSPTAVDGNGGAERKR